MHLTTIAHSRQQCSPTNGDLLMVQESGYCLFCEDLKNYIEYA